MTTYCLCPKSNAPPAILHDLRCHTTSGDTPLWLAVAGQHQPETILGIAGVAVDTQYRPASEKGVSPDYRSRARARARARDFKANKRHAKFENATFPKPSTGWTVSGWLAPSVRWHHDPLLSPALGILMPNQPAIQPEGLPENSRRQAPRRRRNWRPNVNPS